MTKLSLPALFLVATLQVQSANAQLSTNRRRPLLRGLEGETPTDDEKITDFALGDDLSMESMSMQMSMMVGYIGKGSTSGSAKSASSTKAAKFFKGPSGKSGKSKSSKESCLQAEMQPSNGNSFPDAEGTVRVCFTQELSETSGELRMGVDGLQPNIQDGGVHIHVGTSCDDAASQGPHYFNEVDPWFNAPSAIAPTGTSYSTDTSGRGSADFLFDQGFGFNDTVGRVVVVHESFESGFSRIACGVLE